MVSVQYLREEHRKGFDKYKVNIYGPQLIINFILDYRRLSENIFLNNKREKCQ